MLRCKVTASVVVGPPLSPRSRQHMYSGGPMGSNSSNELQDPMGHDTGAIRFGQRSPSGTVLLATLYHSWDYAQCASSRHMMFCFLYRYSELSPVAAEISESKKSGETAQVARSSAVGRTRAVAESDDYLWKLLKLDFLLTVTSSSLRQIR